MKIRPISVRFTQQKGFSLLEALLSIVIILAAGLGVVELFISADKKNKAGTVQQIVQQAASAESQLLSASYNETSIGTDEVVKSGLIASTYISSAGGIVGPYGKITVDQVLDTNSQYYVTAITVPGDQAVNICQNMFTSSAISVAANNGTYAESVSGCQTLFGTDGSTALKTMVFNFPRENYIDNVS